MSNHPPEHLNTIFARNIKSERLSRGITQSQLALLTGLSIRYISCLESGQQNLNLDKIQMISDALEIAPDHLFKGRTLGQIPASSAEQFHSAINTLQSIFVQFVQ